MKTQRSHVFAGGFAFIEIAVVLAVISLLAAFATQAFSSTTDAQERTEAIEHARLIQASIKAYALRNGRMPCPSSDERGYENRVSGSCAAGVQTGFVPYVTLGLQIPAEKYLARYAIYRASNADLSLDADLTENKERTGDAAGEPGYLNTYDLIAALTRIDASTVDSTYPYVTGDAGAAGDINCSANKVSTVAYWLILPMADANNDGNRLDSINTASSLCATYPLAARTAQFDDVVLSETPLQLAGWLKLWSLP